MSINKRIDHTLLKPEATEKEVRTYCKEALDHGFASVVVNSNHLALVVKLLKNTPVQAVAVVGFPLGAMAAEVKAFEAHYCGQMGADEIDMVMDIGALKSKNYTQVQRDIQGVIEASKPARVKVILETSLLTDQEKCIACDLSVSCGASYVKTSTGFSSSGATLEDIRLIKAHIRDQIFIKASGGIVTSKDAKALVDAGADRLGIGDGKRIIKHI